MENHAVQNTSCLIGSSSDDPHAIIISKGLTKLGIGTTFVDTVTFDDFSKRTVKDNSSLPDASCIAGVVPQFASISSAWFRRSRFAMTAPDGVLRLNSDELFKNRLHGVFGQSLWEVLDDALNDSVTWVNPVIEGRLAENKILQLRAARSVGLCTPETVLTNDADEVRSLLSRHSEIICKSLMPFTWQEHGSIFNNLSSKIMSIDGIEQAVSRQMAIYQPYIAKRHELRVTVMDGHFFVTRIDSQTSASGKIDWRGGIGNEVRLEKGCLDSAIKDKLLQLMATLKLVFATCDFIVTPDNEHVFLELNQAGNFLWQEKTCPELRLTEAMCALLAHGTLAGWRPHEYAISLQDLEK